MKNGSLLTTNRINWISDPIVDALQPSSLTKICGVYCLCKKQTFTCGDYTAASILIR